jgi:hypothetical protein
MDEVLDRIDRRQGGGRVGMSQAVDTRSPVAVTTARGPLLLRTGLIAVWYQPGDLPVPRRRGTCPAWPGAGVASEHGLDPVLSTHAQVVGGQRGGPTGNAPGWTGALCDV